MEYRIAVNDMEDYESISLDATSMYVTVGFEGHDPKYVSLTHDQFRELRRAVGYVSQEVENFGK